MRCSAPSGTKTWSSSEAPVVRMAAIRYESGDGLLPGRRAMVESSTESPSANRSRDARCAPTTQVALSTAFAPRPTRHEGFTRWRASKSDAHGDCVFRPFHPSRFVRRFRSFLDRGDGIQDGNRCESAGTLSEGSEALHHSLVHHVGDGCRDWAARPRGSERGFLALRRRDLQSSWAHRRGIPGSFCGAHRRKGSRASRPQLPPPTRRRWPARLEAVSQ